MNVLLVPAHPGFPGQIPQSRKTVVVVVVVVVVVPCGRLSWLLPAFDRTLISHSYLLTY